MHMKKTMLLVLLFSTSFAIAQKESPASKYAKVITAQSMKEKLTILAGPEMEGRETAMPGERKAAAFIEDHYKKIGLLPGNGNSYQQYFPVYEDEISAKQLRVNGQNFEWDKDFSFSMVGLFSSDWTVNDIVFAGYGIVNAEPKMNDYEGLDVKGKIVMVLDGAPEGFKAPAAVPGRPGPTAQLTKMLSARTLGAIGIFVVANNFPRKTPTALKGNLYFTKSTNAPFTLANISENVATALIGRTAKQSISNLAALQKGKYVSEVKLAVIKNIVDLQSSNVVGIIPGTDKKDEYVFLTGHHDHLGKRGDVIYYGADDDGSGTVGVMQMAEAFAAAAKKGIKPRRTMVFMTVSGEEKGLVGSNYYSEHPIFSMEKTSVDLNIDMIGRVDTERKTADTLNYIYVIGHDKLSSDLPIINEAANNAHTKLTLDYKYDDPQDKNRIYYRSDHYNFAKKGVPILFFYDGMLKSDYHQPSDTVEKINFELMEKRAKLVYYTAWDIANRDNMLKRDIPLNMPNSR